ncbi:hypothetical protein LZ31DRAFT_292128 [Colletotrichum somersetense]|nr:hypothetical protein LZ31DRAFT_292128 [Colletotrichum somersetense]
MLLLLLLLSSRHHMARAKYLDSTILPLAAISRPERRTESNVSVVHPADGRAEDWETDVSTTGRAPLAYGLLLLLNAALLASSPSLCRETGDEVGTGQRYAE